MKDSNKIYTPQRSIPVCAVRCGSAGEILLQFKKSGDKETEEMQLGDFISLITSSVLSISVERPDTRLSQTGRRKN